MNRPELIIAPLAMQNTCSNPKSLLSFIVLLFTDKSVELFGKMSTLVLYRLEVFLAQAILFHFVKKAT